MSVQVFLVGKDQQHLLDECAKGVFDDPLDARSTREFLADPRHHLAIAVEDEVVVGFASAVHYLHPDKVSPELWINEVGIAETHRRLGLGKRLLAALLDKGEELGCSEAWVLTDRSNLAAKRLYASIGGMEGPEDQVMFTIAMKHDGH